MNTPKPLTLAQKLFLTLAVPCLMLVLLELGARAVRAALTTDTPAGPGTGSAAAPQVLEMPTWMLSDANALARAQPSSDSLEWLNLFVAGDGFRVHLIPGSQLAVKNTFSLIAADRERRYLIRANSLGFRGPEVAPRKPPHTFRITVFGDSSSFGWGVDEADTWWSLLRAELQHRYPATPIEVANFAIPGDSSAYGRLLFEQFAPRFESDLTILGFGANDAKPVYTSHTDQVARFQQRGTLLQIVGVLKWSALVQLLEQAITRRTQRGEPRPRPRIPAVAAEDFRGNLEAMGQQARALGSKEVLLLGLCTPAQYARQARSAAQRGKFLWLNAQSQLLKALPQIQKQELYPEYVQRLEQRAKDELSRNRLFYITSDGCHPNELGNRFVADKLLQLVESSPPLQAALSSPNR